MPPLDLEEFVRQRQAAALKRPVPRFIPKKEREQKAAEQAAREAEEKAAKEAKMEKIRRENEAMLRQPRGQTGSGYIPTGPRSMTNGAYGPQQAPLQETNGTHPRHRDGQNGDAKLPVADRDEALIRERYMGPEVNTKSKFTAGRKRKRDRTKFKFDWDPEEDTTRPEDLETSRPDRAPRFYELDGPNFNYDEVAEQNVKKRAEMMRERNLERADEQADQLLRDFYEYRAKYREKQKKTGLDLHWSDKSLEDMRERDWRIFKEDFGISTKGGSIPNPMRNWRESELPKRLLDIVDQVGYKEPTPIQRAAIPIALQARDLIGVAVTGSGKTAAFLLPLLVYISDLPPLTELNKNDGPYGLVLAPTRELAQQIESEARKFAEPLGFRCVSIVGGHSLEEQAFALRNGAEIIVATPGRLVDCIERRLLVLSQCCYIIMDEADKMIDMGFEEPLNKILDALPATNEKPDTHEAENAHMMKKYLGSRDRYRQTMMYTATMPPLVEKIAKKYLRRPAIVTIGNAGEAVDTVEQRVEFIAGEDRRKKRLADLLTSGEFGAPIVVFVNIKRNCDAVARDLSKLRGITVATLHGSKDQRQREAALASVRRGEAQVLVATDVAARGIDLQDVSLVVNFNMATNIEQYTHRIGRTGRAGKSGVAITFLGNEDADVMYDLRQILSKSSISRVPEELKRHEAAQQRPNRGGQKAVVFQ